MKLTDIFNKKSGPDEARLNLARWYNEVEKFDYMEFNYAPVSLYILCEDVKYKGIQAHS